jgi:hypothetical protein
MQSFETHRLKHTLGKAGTITLFSPFFHSPVNEEYTCFHWLGECVGDAGQGNAWGESMGGMHGGNGRGFTMSSILIINRLSPWFYLTSDVLVVF